MDTACQRDKLVSQFKNDIGSLPNGYVVLCYKLKNPTCYFLLKSTTDDIERQKKLGT